MKDIIGSDHLSQGLLYSQLALRKDMSQYCHTLQMRLACKNNRKLDIFSNKKVIKITNINSLMDRWQKEERKAFLTRIIKDFNQIFIHRYGSMRVFLYLQLISLLKTMSWRVLMKLVLLGITSSSPTDRGELNQQENKIKKWKFMYIFLFSQNYADFYELLVVLT